MNRASTAARNEKEKGIALQYENEDALNERSEGLLTVLGVEPPALLEMVRWVRCYRAVDAHLLADSTAAQIYMISLLPLPHPLGKKRRGCK